MEVENYIKIHNDLLERYALETLESKIQRIKYYAKLDGIYNISNWNDYISDEYLKNNFNDDIPISNHKNLFDFSFLKIQNKFVHLLKEIYPDKQIYISGHFYYPNTGFMSWHTNSDTPCERMYITWASEENKSFFRYYDGEKIITDYDKKGITIRKFIVTGEKPYFWHCVGSECDRISIGFRIV